MFSLHLGPRGCDPGESSHSEMATSFQLTAAVNTIQVCMNVCAEVPARAADMEVSGGKASALPVKEAIRSLQTSYDKHAIETWVRSTPRSSLPAL